MTYDKGGYLWINDMQPKVIMHPTQPQLDGKDVSDYKDPNGKALFVEFVKVCKENGEGFVEYMWPKPGATMPVPKISYVKVYAPWGWIVGTGAYMDGITAEVSALRWKIVIGFGLLALVMAVTAVTVGRNITRPLKRLSNAVERLAGGDLSVRLDGSHAGDEVGTLAQGIDRMVGSFDGMIAGILASANTVVSTVDVMTSKVEKASRRSRGTVNSGICDRSVSGRDEPDNQWDRQERTDCIEHVI